MELREDNVYRATQQSVHLDLQFMSPHCIGIVYTTVCVLYNTIKPLICRLIYRSYLEKIPYRSMGIKQDKCHFSFRFKGRENCKRIQISDFESIFAVEYYTVFFILMV